MVPRRGDSLCTSRRCELRHLSAWAEGVITGRQTNVSIDRVGARHPRLQQLSPRLVAGSHQYPRAGEVELMAFLQRVSGDLRSNGCGGYLKADEGSIMSPEFPHQYRRCIWTIEVPTGLFIVLLFEEFKVSTNVAAAVSTPDCSMMHISNNLGGPLPVTEPIKQVHVEQIWAYSKQYTRTGKPHNKRGSTLTSRLEDQPDCRNNYLEIFDGPSESSPVIGKLCGSDLPPPIASKDNTVTLKFVTEEASRKNKFKVKHQLDRP
ncbi:hypothetical protein SprV_0200613800 [Sparganum proliferum]